MERDRHAVAGEGGDDAHLIAEAEHARRVGGGWGVDEPVRDAEDGGGAARFGRAAGEARPQMRLGALQIREQCFPRAAGPLQAGVGYQQA